jgi:hypothetical protein
MALEELKLFGADSSRQAGRPRWFRETGADGLPTVTGCSSCFALGLLACRWLAFLMPCGWV